MGGKNEVERQLEILGAGVSEILPQGGLSEKLELSLEQNRPLRVKLGIDPTTSNVHIGHMVPYRKLRQFQDLGHIAVLIIGDFTATIGDPSGKNRERPGLSFDQVRENASSYCSQIFKVIDESRAEIHFQSTWFDKAGLRDTIEIASEFSVAHLLSHETFRSRLEDGSRLSLHELLYPILQAWDSIAIHADIELGGMDQRFNILCGRDLQRSLNRVPQTAVFLPLLPGTDGEKMSKTSGNHISILDPPDQMYGKVMSIADGLLPDYLRLASSLNGIESWEPYKLKKLIAQDIVETYHGKEAGRLAADHFLRTVSQGQIPEVVPELALEEGEYLLVDLIFNLQLISSKSEGRRLITQGGVKIDHERVSDPGMQIRVCGEKKILLQYGKRKWVTLIPRG